MNVNNENNFSSPQKNLFSFESALKQNVKKFY